MTRLAWLTDIHLDHLQPDKTFKFGKMVSADACVITGDIASGNTVCDLLSEFQRGFGKPMYFVIGNHDAWNSSFGQVRADLTALCSKNNQLHFLDDGQVYDLGMTQLCGVSGFYDAQAGDAKTSRIGMNDWFKIEELKKPVHTGQLVPMLRKLGLESAASAQSVLAKVNASKPVLFATHVPPFVEASWHMGRRSDRDALPYYTNLSLGYALNDWAEQNQGTELTTICGHCHSAGEYQARTNHLVLTGGADYGNPKVQRIFDV